MQTVFCGACGHIYAKGESVSFEPLEQKYAACPECDASPLPLMMGFGEMSAEDARRAVSPAHSVTVRPGEDLNAALERSLREQMGGGLSAGDRTIATTPRGRVVLTFVWILGTALGGVAGYFYRGGLFWTIGGALLGGMMLVVVVDWLLTRLKY